MGVVLNAIEELWVARGPRSDMTRKTARSIGGFGALLLGAVALDFFPPLGVLETVAAVILLMTHRRGAALVALLPTALLLLTAVQVMVTVSGPGNPIMWPIAAATTLTGIALLRGGLATNTSVRRPG